jgi:hypothetical protein
MKIQQHYSIPARKVKAVTNFDSKDFAVLPRMGIDVTKLYDSTGMDSLNGLQMTAASIGTPAQFLQSFLPGFVANATAPRVIDELVGIVGQANWYDEEVVQGTMELTGKASMYGDFNNVPLSSYNSNYEKRTIVRFEQGYQETPLTSARSDAMGLNEAQAKRNAAVLSLDISRNDIGFYGFNNGSNRTYGLLNDPNLPAYTTFPAGAGGSTEWQFKTFEEQRADITAMHAALTSKTSGIYDPDTVSTVLVLPVTVNQYLAVTTALGYSVKKWMSETYPNTRVKLAPQFNAANGGLNVAYLFVEAGTDEYSTDDKQTFVQVVPTKFTVIGTQQTVKGRIEDYVNATAGVMCKRPMNVVRFTGL